MYKEMNNSSRCITGITLWIFSYQASRYLPVFSLFLMKFSFCNSKLHHINCKHTWFSGILLRTVTNFAYCWEPWLLWESKWAEQKPPNNSSWVGDSSRESWMKQPERRLSPRVSADRKGRMRMEENKVTTMMFILLTNERERTSSGSREGENSLQGSGKKLHDEKNLFFSFFLNVMQMVNNS